MTIDRRSFIYAGGLTAAAAPLAIPGNAAAGPVGRSITDFGVEPNVDRDQTQAIQKAIDELARVRQPVIFPAGVFSATKLTLPNVCSIIGVPGMTSLKLAQLSVNDPDGTRVGMLALDGIMFSQHKATSNDPMLVASSANIRNCIFSGEGKTAAILGPDPSYLSAVVLEKWSDAAVVSSSSNLVIEGCRFSACGVGIGTKENSVTSVTNSRFETCAIAAVVNGTAVLNGNIITGARNFGVKLGSAKGDGHILCQSNLIRDCRIGIAVSSSGDDIMCSLNMIAGARDGAIRAFDGDRLVGPDLARQSAEAYLNLMVAGNVVR